MNISRNKFRRTDSELSAQNFSEISCLSRNILKFSFARIFFNIFTPMKMQIFNCWQKTFMLNGSKPKIINLHQKNKFCVRLKSQTWNYTHTHTVCFIRTQCSLLLAIKRTSLANKSHDISFVSQVWLKW